MTRFPILLALFLSVATGLVPLRECHPTDGCRGGVVLPGAHDHAGDRDGGDDRDGGCVDVPIPVGLPVSAVVVDAPPAAVAFAAIEPPPPALVASAPGGDAPLLAAVPSGIRSVVLLR